MNVYICMYCMYVHIHDDINKYECMNVHTYIHDIHTCTTVRGTCMYVHVCAHSYNCNTTVN